MPLWHFWILRELLIAPQLTIIQAMIRHDSPEALMDWTENMLAGRRIMVYHREKMVEGTQDRGCPQGGHWGSIPTTVVPCSKRPLKSIYKEKVFTSTVMQMI